MLEFSAILSAVRPKQRTDQYQILAALFFLGARNSPVTAKQVSDLLSLHVRKGLPTNIGASLRSYTRYVEQVDSTRPLRWKLTASGLEQLRVLSGLELSVETKASDFDTDVAFVCALEYPEFHALEQAIGGPGAWTDLGESQYSHVTRSAAIATTSGTQLNVVGTVTTSMGLTSAAIATTQLVFRYKPRIVVMVGIAAGTKTGDKGFGDILVADPSVDYNSGKVVLENGVRGFLPDPYPIGLNARLRSVIQRYRSPNSLFQSIYQGWNAARPQHGIRLHLGPLGAADQVIDDATRILEVQKNWRKLIGVEMETYGVYRACHEAPEPKPRVVSFKSVCDFAAEKTDSWQEYAAYTAATFAVEFLKREWNALWPEITHE